MEYHQMEKQNHFLSWLFPIKNDIMAWSSTHQNEGLHPSFIHCLENIQQLKLLLTSKAIRGSFSSNDSKSKTVEFFQTPMKIGTCRSGFYPFKSLNSINFQNSEHFDMYKNALFKTFPLKLKF